MNGPGSLTIESPESSVLFNATLGEGEGDGNALKFLNVKGNVISAASITTQEDLNLDAATHLRLTGATYTSQKGDVRFNETERTDVTQDATILRLEGDVSIKAKKGFVIGKEQKFLVNAGSLTITAQTALLGDVAAKRVFIANVGEIQFNARPVQEKGVNNDFADQGVGIVAERIAINGDVKFAPGSKSTDKAFIVAKTIPTVTGSVAVGISSQVEKKGEDILSQFDQDGKGKPIANVSDFTGSEAFPIKLQPIANGVSQAGSAEKQKATTERQNKPLAIAIDSRLSAADLFTLKTIGLTPRAPTNSEILSEKLGQAIYAQPAEGFMGTYEFTDFDYEVVTTRIQSKEIGRVTDKFRDLIGSQVPDTAEFVNAKANSASLRTLLDRFRAAQAPATTPEFVGPVESLDPAKEAVNFVAWLEQQKGADNEVRNVINSAASVGEIVRDLPKLGLTVVESNLASERIIGLMAEGSQPYFREIIKQYAATPMIEQPKRRSALVFIPKPTPPESSGIETPIPQEKLDVTSPLDAPEAQPVPQENPPAPSGAPVPKAPAPEEPAKTSDSELKPDSK